MGVCTFFCVLPDGSPGTLKLIELAGDEAARAFGEALLAEHGSCDRVEVYEDDRLVAVASQAAA